MGISALRTSLFCGCMAVAVVLYGVILFFVPLTEQGIFAATMSLLSVAFICMLGFLVTGLPYLRMLAVVVILVVASAWFSENGETLRGECARILAELSLGC